MITNEIEYKNLQKQIQEKYQTAFQQLEKQREDDLAALEKVWTLIQEQEVIKSATKVDNSSQRNYGSLTAAVKYAVQKIEQRRFTKDDVLSEMIRLSPKIAENCNHSSLCGALGRLEKQGWIKRTRKGKGSSPNIYKKVEEHKKQAE